MEGRTQGGGDRQGRGNAPKLATTQTVETARPENTGDSHNTISSTTITSDPLWPLVVVLGDIARRVSRHAGDNRPTSRGADR